MQIACLIAASALKFTRLSDLYAFICRNPLLENCKLFWSLQQLLRYDDPQYYYSTIGMKVLRPPSFCFGFWIFLISLWQILGEESPIIKHFENNHAGKVSSIMLEMESTEICHLSESQDALRKKLIEAMNSLL